MRILTSDEIRQVEQTAYRHLPERTLMLRAAQAAADFALRKFRGPYLILAGPGNNGGDALETARLLNEAWQKVTVILLADPHKLPSAARAAYLAATRSNGLTIDHVLPPLQGWGCIIDGLFGIGLTRPLDPRYAEIVQKINQAAIPVLALDLPSGLNADTGRVVGGQAGIAIQAQHTLTFIAGKPGLWTGAGRDYVGNIHLDDLALDLDASLGGVLNTPAVFAQTLRPRPFDSHKGTFGNVYIVGGAPGMAGAALLAGRAALYAGAGRVYVYSLAGLALDPSHPELMCRDAFQAPTSMDSHDNAIWVCGPGLGQEPNAIAWVDTCVRSAQPLVLDADALNILATSPNLVSALRKRTAPTILTPHPLEAARLLDEDVASINADRLRIARALADNYRAHVVLKGAGSIVVAANNAAPWVINPTGNPGLATAGSGDVLSGLLGARLAQTPTLPFAATCAAVWLHGQAADDCVRQGKGPQGLTASDLLPALRASLNQLTSALDQS